VKGNRADPARQSGFSMRREPRQSREEHERITRYVDSFRLNVLAPFFSRMASTLRQAGRRAAAFIATEDVEVLVVNERFLTRDATLASGFQDFPERCQNTQRPLATGEHSPLRCSRHLRLILRKASIQPILEDELSTRPS
jgi:hypothetical protein